MVEDQTADDTKRSRGWAIAALLVGLGGFLLALVDARNMNPDDSSTIGLRLLAWALVFSSALAIRHVGKWLLLYLPGVWIIASIVAVSLVVPAIQLTSIFRSFGDCGEVNEYLDQLEVESEHLNSRIDTLSAQTNLSDANLQAIIDATRTDVSKLRAVEVPDPVNELHRQRIDLTSGWIEVFEAVRDGTFQEEMLFDLQGEDDEFERLYRVAASECS